MKTVCEVICIKYFYYKHSNKIKSNNTPTIDKRKWVDRRLKKEHIKYKLASTLAKSYVIRTGNKVFIFRTSYKVSSLCTVF